MKARQRQSKKGKVVLVGAGPGDVGLLTIRGKEALRRADTVVYDWLVSEGVLQYAPTAQKIFVGKKGGRHYSEQHEINQILFKLAREGKFVVRLKGGDPFVFGRGAEEAIFLVKHKIPFEVIPGVSAGIGVPAYAGIPLTDRHLASQVTFVTGHEDPTKESSQIDWKELGRSKGTLVSFMGVGNLSKIIHALTAEGKSPRTPIAVIEWGTLPSQRVVVGTLGDILKKVQKAKVKSPALTVIGHVVRLRSRLAWFEKRPLSGKTVVVTRARAQASKLVQRLRECGANVLEFPTIEIHPPSHPQEIDREICGISQYDWVVFTSVNAVESFFGRMRRLGKDARIFSNVRIAAIGEVTAQGLSEKGLRADLVPEEFTSQALFRSLKAAGEIRGRKFLLVRADIAPPDFKKNLEQEGASVLEIEAYRTRAVSKHGALPLYRWLRQGKIDYVTFTSSSTVQNFFDSIPPAFRKRIRSRFVSIGPVTSETLRKYGYRPAREARRHTLEGLVDTLINGGKP